MYAFKIENIGLAGWVGSRVLTCLPDAERKNLDFIPSLTLTYDCPTRGKKPPGRTGCSCRWGNEV